MERVTVNNKEIPPLPNMEELRWQVSQVLGLFHSDEYYIDEGGAGKIYRLPVGYCMKLVKNRHDLENSGIYDLGNNAYVEARFQQRMSNTKYEGKTRVPKILGVVENVTPQGHTALIMEELDAVNIQHIIKGKAELPPNFNVEDFLSEVEDFIDHMQTNERIAHMDLYARNLMADKKTGSPYVIDFGRSVTLGSDTDKNREFEDNDWKRLEEVYVALSSLQKK